MAGLLKSMGALGSTGVTVRNVIYDYTMKRTSAYVGVILVGAMGVQQVGDTVSEMVWNMHNQGVRLPSFHFYVFKHTVWG
eukprot:SAG31_NODE_179_length_21090_cov_11.862871_9_plen_80_part_00